ncbi:NAD(P)/FAD-dependent oxidoreductase [Utexia brackfieldae]|uniref:NAD(P)/FAD-dependent oxidoreductase n=1 Tax=Utexia brackfieldae TaxID=3074108 RepID=UPI00370D14FC
MNEITIIGAGAAGLFCAGILGQQGRNVTVIDNGKRVGRKILMSGGGKCNFTNMTVSAENYISANPHFCKSALSRYTQWDFLDLVSQYNIAWHERDHGQLFCDHSAQDIVNMLVQECQKGQIKFQLQTQFESLQATDTGFQITTDKGTIFSQKVIVATGGLSMPALGMTPLAYQVAQSLNIAVEPVRAGLVPFTLQKPLLDKLIPLSGTAISVLVTSEQGNSFKENLLFTHRGLSGPVILQISNYWQPGEAITINLLPDTDLNAFLINQHSSHPNQSLKNTLARLLPKRLVEVLIEHEQFPDLPLKQLTAAQKNHIVAKLTQWQIQPNGTEGYRTAEVTLGGISTDCLSSKTMASKDYPNLYFIGEVVDVAGWLGGYNFQWAWSSAFACANGIITS